MKNTQPHPSLNPQCLALVAQALFSDAPRSGITFYATDPEPYGEFNVPQGLVDVLREGPPINDPNFVSSLAACLQALAGLWIRETHVATLIALASDTDGLDLADNLDLEIDVSPDGEAIAICSGFALVCTDRQWRVHGSHLIEAPTRSLRTALAAVHRARLEALDPNLSGQN